MIAVLEKKLDLYNDPTRPEALQIRAILENGWKRGERELQIDLDELAKELPPISPMFILAIVGVSVAVLALLLCIVALCCTRGGDGCPGTSGKSLQ